MNIEELESKIKYYSEMYYKGTPVIDDITFDNLVDELKKLKSDSPVLTTGWGFEVDGDKVKHKYSHIGSLDKCKSFEEISDRFKNKKVYISPKLDGLSAVAYYKDGKLVQGITRGNGEYGKDITQKLSIILGPQIQDKTFTGAVRGELIINETNWKELQGKYKDLIAPRNFAAGIINRKEIDEDIKYIDLVVYKIVGQEPSTITKSIYKSREEILYWLSYNFKNVIPNYYYPILSKEAWEMYHTQTFEEFKKLGYGLDGLVLTDPDVQYNTQTKGYIYNEEAFKFKAETDETIIKDIEWTLSRTQRLVPVAIVEPVELSGAIINRCTCNNAKMVQDLNIGVGAKVEITRSNEVIPQIVKVLEEVDYNLPTNCPICGSQLEWDGVDLKCKNTDCPNIEESDLEQWCLSVGETDGLQWSLIKPYLDIFNIHSVDNLYDKQTINKVIMDFNIRQLSITDQKIKSFFNKLYFEKIPVEKVLIGLNIPRLGDKTSQQLGKEPELLKQLLIYCINYNANINDIPKYVELKNSLEPIVKEATTKSLFENIKKFIHFRYMYADGNFVTEDSRIIFNNKQNNNEINYVAVTGSLNTMKRKDFEKYINQYGYELSSNLKKCKYLITNNPDSGSSKNKQAQEYNVEIITEQDFLNIINK